LHFNPALVPTVHLHSRGFSNDHIVWPDAFHIYQGISGDTVAPLFHIAEVVRRITFKRAYLAGQRKAVDHPWRAALFIAGPARIENSVLDLASERVPLPLGFIADAYGVDMAIVKQYCWPVSDATQDIAHLVKANVVEAKPVHLGSAALSDRPNLA